ncbi:hypothetical protein M8J77_018382 [Diaphorina citri]|nr:hypothetical protein M8J77_018382 [Diaphorina citri]
MKILAKESEEAIKDSGVLTVKDAFAWNWEAIRAVFKTRAQPIVRLEESSHKMFLKKIVYFLLPSNNQLSRCDLYSSNNNNVYSLAAIDLLKFLLDCEHAEATRLLQEFLADLHDQLDCILTSESAHDTLLSPKNVSNTLCQHYFLFVGVLSNRNRGLQFLESSGVLEVLNRVALTSKHDCYVKLIVSSLDYSTSGATRLILSNILTCDQVSSRLYATQFLSILLRTKLELQPDYLNWVVESIVNQLQDEKKLVSLCALSALDEACDDKHYLEAVIALRPSLLYFGDKGLLLLIRFLSTTSGFTYLNEANFVSNQLERWATHFNYRYVQLMEADIHDSLTLHRRTEDGQYARRLSSARPPIGTAYVLPHLYGMLARHEAGFGVLRSHEHLYALFQRIIDGRCSTDEQILDLKAALWAAGNLATSPAGVRLLSEQGVLLPIVRLAEQCAVYSVRATGFYVLSMIATTRQGVALLHSMGWVSVRQNRHDLWPLVTCPLSSPPTTPEYMMEISASQQAAMGGHTSEESSESSDHVTPLFYMEDSGPGRSSLDTPLPWFRGKERASSERRSATLPHKSAMAPVPQHVRSYSESKAEMGSGVGDSWENTTDGQSHVTDELSDMRMSDVCKKSRSDSCCTDSSTSGVSSCDSSHAPRYHAIGEKVHQTLSPIPSTGSIATMKSVHPKPPDTSGGTTSKHRNSFSLRSKLMTQHSIGHSTFLSLRSLRPHPSPSVSIDLINFAEGNKMSPLVRPKLSAKYMHQPVSSEFEVTELPGLLLSDEEPTPTTPTVSSEFEVTELPGLLLSDEEPTPTTPTVLAGAYPSSRSCIVGPAGQPTFGESETEDLWSGPCYQGICLPLHLPQMFPSLETIYSQENTHRLERGLDTEITSDQEAVDSDNEVEESKKPKFKHDRSCCLLCVVKYAPNRSQILRNRKISSSSIHRTRTETESSYGGGVGGEGESPILVPWPQQKTPALCETTPASGESSASHDNAFGFAKALMDSSSQSRSSVRKELLRLVELMANPILFRTCKQGLLTIKQSCKDLFQDVCVYSDVCNILAWCNHRLQARRFLQDLFVDSTFNELQEEPKSILTISPSCSLETDDLAHVATTSDRRDTASCDTDLDKAASTACELEVILESEGGGEASHRIDGEGQSRPADIVRPAKCDLNGCEGDRTPYSRREQDSSVVETPHSRLENSGVFQIPHSRLETSRGVETPHTKLTQDSRVVETPHRRLENPGVGATSIADSCEGHAYSRVAEDSNSRCAEISSRLNQDAQNMEPSCTLHPENTGDLPYKNQCPGGVPYKDPCPGGIPYEDPCDEVWCPETKSDLILEKFESVYRSDSIDELSDEVLFLKPCSSRLVLSSPGEQSADCRGTQTLSQRSLPLDQSGNVQPKSVSTSQLPSVPLDACLQTSLPTDPGCESVCQSGFSGTPTPQTAFSGNVPTTPQNHPTSLGLLDQTIASSRHCRARQYAEPLPSVSNESSALIPSDKNERYGVPVSKNSSVKETSSDGDGSSSFLVHRPGADKNSGGSMNISTSQALNENISTSRELHENISIPQAMGIETSSSLHSSNTDLSGARLSEPTSISRAMSIETPILHSSNTDPSGDRINKSSLISQSRDQSSAYSHQLTPTTSQLTDASNQSLPTGLNPGDSSLPSPSPERDVPNSPPPCIEPPSVSCSQSRLSSQPLNSSSSLNNPSSLSSQNSTNNQSSLHSPHSQNNPKSLQSSLNNPSVVNSPKSLHRPNSPISSSSQNSSDSKVSLGPLCSDSTANPQVENDPSRVPQVKSVTSKVQLAAKSQVENTNDVQPVSPSVVQLANLSVVQLVNSSVVQLANPSEVESANASVVESASPCHAKTVSSNQHTLSSSESSDENFDRHTGREKTSVPRRISVEAVIEQIPRDVERGDVPGTDRLKGLVGSSHPEIDLCKGLSESSVDKDKQEGQDQLKESSVDKDQHKRSKEIDGQTDEIGKTSEKVPKLDESKEVCDPMSQSNELDQKTETRTSTCTVSNPGQNLDPKPDAKVSASDNTNDGSPKKEIKRNEAKKSKSKASEPASKGNSGKNNSKLPLVKNKETSPSELNRSKVAGGESKSKPSKQGEVSQKQASKDQTQASLGDSTGKNAETKKNLNETGVKSEETKRNSKTSTSIRTSSDVSTGSKSSGSTSEENLNKSTTVSDRKGTIKTPPANTNEPVAKDKPSSRKTTEPSSDKLTSPSGKKATEPSAKSVTTGPVKKSVPKTSTSPNEEGASKPLALSARKSLPLTTSTEFASCKSVALSARKSLPLTSSSDAGAKPTQGDLGKPITLIKTNGLGEDCRMKPTSSIPVVSQHRKMSVYKPPIPGMSD